MWRRRSVYSCTPLCAQSMPSWQAVLGAISETHLSTSDITYATARALLSSVHVGLRLVGERLYNSVLEIARSAVVTGYFRYAHSSRATAEQMLVTPCREHRTRSSCPARDEQVYNYVVARGQSRALHRGWGGVKINSYDSNN